MEILLSIHSKADDSIREVKCAIGDGLRIGRGAEGGVLLEGLDLSREHLVLTADDADLYVEDLSVNGTWLNGTRLRKSIKSRARVGDSIELPGYSLRFRFVDQPEEKPAGPLAEALQPAPEDVRIPATKKSGARAVLDPVLQFIGSFTLMEKFLVVVGLAGLLLLYTYLGS